MQGMLQHGYWAMESPSMNNYVQHIHNNIKRILSQQADVKHALHEW